MHERIALHTWTLDSTPLDHAFRVAGEVGYDGVELRYADFLRCRAAGMSEEAMLRLVRDAGIAVAEVGTESGMLFAADDEAERLLGSLRYACEKAVALGCDQIMMPPGPVAAGASATPERRLRDCAEIAAGHGLKFALEFNSRHPVVRTLEAGLELVVAVDMDNCGLLIDTYHLCSSGGGARSIGQVPVEKIFMVQFSDIPAGPATQASVPIDRLPPGDGVVPFAEIFATLMAKRYRGYLSYEAPNPGQWNRPAQTVAREGLTRVRALLEQAEQLNRSGKACV